MENLPLPSSLYNNCLRVLWALDPAEQNLRPSLQEIRYLKSFFGGSFLSVKPVFVRPTDEMPLGEVQKQVREYLAPLVLGPTDEIEVIYSPSKDKAEWAERILRLAKLQESDIILLSSHGRSALGAFFMGSFANELLQKSNLPLMFMAPQLKYSVAEKKAMFATDFSAGSKEAFLEFLKTIQGKVSDLILFHAAGPAMLPLNPDQIVGLASPLSDSLLREQQVSVAQELQHWLESAEKRNIQVRSYAFAETSVNPIATAIQEFADSEQVGLIGLYHHVSPLVKILAGSIVQELIAKQRHNLWVSGPAMRPR